MKVDLRKKEITAIIEALRYDLEENGYSYLKDNLIVMLRTFNGEITFLKNGDVKIKQEILRKPILAK